MKNKLLLASILMLGSVNSAYALNALQLGGDGSAGWEYDNGTQTWVTSDSSFTMNAYANCIDGQTGCEAPHGDYAWGLTADATQTAYIVVAAVPKGTAGDAFDISIVGDGGALTFESSGYGRPPLTDPNDLQPHGVFDTYYEIYSFQFNGDVGSIFDTQPGETGTGDGFTESFDITVSLFEGVEGVHFDLFTLDGQGLVLANAPYSHDAEYRVPAPGAALLMGLGLIGLVGLRKKVG